MAPQMRLGDFLADHPRSLLFRGFRLAHFAARDGVAAIDSLPVVTVRSLDGIACDPSLFDERPFSRYPRGRFATREGDLLIGLASPYRVACVDGDALDAAVSASVAILRLDFEDRDKLDPWFLAGYLNLPSIEATLLPSKASGRNLTLDDIRALEVPRMSVDAQRALGDAARALGLIQKRRRMVGDMEMASLMSHYADLAASAGEEA